MPQTSRLMTSLIGKELPIGFTIFIAGPSLNLIGHVEAHYDP